MNDAPNIFKNETPLHVDDLSTVMNADTKPLCEPEVPLPQMSERAIITWIAFTMIHGVNKLTDSLFHPTVIKEIRRIEPTLGCNKAYVRFVQACERYFSYHAGLRKANIEPSMQQCS